MSGPAPHIQAIVADFGGVLTSPLVGAFADFQDHAGLPVRALGDALRAITEREARHPLHDLEVGRVSEQEFLGKVAAQLRADLGREVPMHEFTERYWARLEPNDELLAFLRSERDHGRRLALLTNNVREWEPRWRRVWPIDELFELVVDSAFVGVRKPDAAIYELLLERLGLPAQACLFIDDLERNVEAARALGFATVRFQDTEQAIADARAAIATAGSAAGS